jgi:serine protease Do
MKRNPVAWAALIVASAALVSSSGFLRSMPAAPKAPLEGQQAAKALSAAYVAVAEFVRPSVVQITVQKKVAGIGGLPGMPNMRRLPRGNGNGNDNMNPRDLEEMLRRFFGPDFGPQREQFGMRNMGVGSGFVFDGNGHILTNNHVVENAEKITVAFYDGVEAPAKVVGTDPQTDVAVIKVDNTSYPALPKGDSSQLKVGEMVMAVGSPFELSQSVTTGIVSALDRNNLGINGRNSYESFIQTDAPINRGNSGGPLVNMNGEVIGINSAIVSGGSGNDGIGFAIPMKLAQGVAEMLIKDGKVHYARVGIKLAPLTAPLARQFGLDAGTKGVLVAEVVPGSPADKAGLKQGDVITSFAGDKVHDASSFKLKVATSEVSHSYELGYVRDGKPGRTHIVPAPADKVVFDIEKGQAGEPSEHSEPAKSAINAFGLAVQPLTEEVAKPLGLPADLKGLVVSSVKEGSPAAEAGIQEGDVITKVVRNRRIQPVTGVEEFQSLASKSDELAIVVQSGKNSRFVTLSKGAK